jgi:hypothetical protein
MAMTPVLFLCDECDDSEQRLVPADFAKKYGLVQSFICADCLARIRGGEAE